MLCLLHTKYLVCSCIHSFIKSRRIIVRRISHQPSHCLFVCFILKPKWKNIFLEPLKVLSSKRTFKPAHTYLTSWHEARNGKTRPLSNKPSKYSEKFSLEILWSFQPNFCAPRTLGILSVPSIWIFRRYFLYDRLSGLRKEKQHWWRRCITFSTCQAKITTCTCITVI